MIDLDKLDKKFEKLFKEETSDSLTKWLLNKRLESINALLGKGRFENLLQKNETFFSNVTKAVFKNNDSYLGNSPFNQNAA